MSTMGKLTNSLKNVLDRDFTSTRREIFTSEDGRATCSLRATTSLKTDKAMKEMSKMESRVGEGITTPMAMFMKDTGKTISEMAKVP